jgi:hypothetical protein
LANIGGNITFEAEESLSSKIAGALTKMVSPPDIVSAYYNKNLPDFGSKSILLVISNH